MKENRYLENQEGSPGSVAAAPPHSAEPALGPEPAPTPAAELNARTLEIVERIVSFAALGHDASGSPQMVLGLTLGDRLALQLSIAAKGDRRIVLRVKSRQARGSEVQEAVARLVEALRARSIDVEDVILDHR